MVQKASDQNTPQYLSAVLLFLLHKTESRSLTELKGGKVSDAGSSGTKLLAKLAFIFPQQLHICSGPALCWPHGLAHRSQG